MGRPSEGASATHHGLPQAAGEPHEAVSRWDGVWKRRREGGKEEGRFMLMES